ncbi:MAG TPA: DUF4394 domain-containing protein [Polyangiales bacterium]|nr:DUF4394 domain-containing protein [Polyangiales bacterium]
MANRHRIKTWLGSAFLLLTPLAHGCGDDDGPDDPAADASTDAARPDAASDASVDSTLPAPPDATASDATTPDASGSDAGLDAAQPAAADTWAVTSAGRLLRFSRVDGNITSSVALTGIAAGETLLGVDVRPSNGEVIALVRVDAGNAGKLYVVDPATGTATLKATLAADGADASEPYTAIAGASFGVDFNPVADRLRVVSDTGQNLRINVESGATTTDGALTPATAGVSAAAYTESFGATCRTRLLVVDGTNRKLLLQDPPNDGRLTEVAVLGDVGTVHGFDIQTSSAGVNTAIYAATASDGERVGTFDLTSGAAGASVKLALNAGETLRAVLAELPTTAPVQARGELLATTTGNKLISFNRGAPGKLCSSVAITGLATETILGADVRPADKALYVLSSAGKLYTVADSGAATLKSTLTADPTDATAPFTTLPEGEYGVGFNPSADRLRIVSSTGVNLRANVDNGNTFTDTDLVQGSTGPGSVSATAYTNTFAGTRYTTMFGIDSNSDNLVRVGGDPADGATCANNTNPNCGAVFVVGALGANVTGVNGFDIDPVNGVALAAVRVGDAAGSTLHVVSLTTGAAAAATGTIGGGELVNSLTFAAAPTLTAWVATGDGKLISFAPSAPGTALATLTLSGLQANEVLLGIDVRPLDGKLYGTGSSGRIYSIDTTTGAATVSSQLTAATGQTFTGLRDATWGFDFNPVADALRMVNPNADNLRILPSVRTAGAAGATFVDTALTVDSDVTGAAYTNGFAGALATTLFVIDGVHGRLLRQGGPDGMPSPNGGVLTEIGTTGLGVTSTGGVNFDIVGGHNGVALAAFTAPDNTTSLYSINLGVGLASAYNPTANAIAGPTAALRGLALTLR